MNKLIEYLEKENDLSVDALKKLYRKLALKAHPDVTRKPGEDFVRLQSEYEAALQYLLALPSSYHKERIGSKAKAQDPRTAFLRALYLFSIMFNGRHWRDSLPELLELAVAYRPDVGRLMNDYRRAFLDTIDEWKQKSFICETHSYLLTAINKLAWYFENNLMHDKRLLSSYLNDLAERSIKLDKEMKKSVLAFGEWLNKEVEGKRVSIMNL